MNVQDPISDLICRICNAQMRRKPDVRVPFSRHKEAIVSVLSSEGYVGDFRVESESKKELVIDLKYYGGQPVIDLMKRASKPSRRLYLGKDRLPRVRNGLGVAIISTSQGVMSDRQARKRGLGGEVICLVA